MCQVEKAHDADLHCVDWNPHDQNLILTGYMLNIFFGSYLVSVSLPLMVFVAFSYRHDTSSVSQ